MVLLKTIIFTEYLFSKNKANVTNPKIIIISNVSILIVMNIINYNVVKLKLVDLMIILVIFRVGM